VGDYHWLHLALLSEGQKDTQHVEKLLQFHSDILFQNVLQSAH